MNVSDKEKSSIHILIGSIHFNINGGCVLLANISLYQSSPNMNNQTTSLLFFSSQYFKIQFKIIKMKVLPCWNEQANKHI